MNKKQMKDSGIAWIGEIPKQWKALPLKSSIKWKSEKNHADAMVLSLYRDYGVVPKDSRDDNYNVTSLDTSGYKFVEIGDLVINKMKAWQGSLAVSDYEGIVSPAYHVCQIINKNILKRYLHYLLRNPSYFPEYRRLSAGLRIGQWDLGFDDFKNIPIILPDIKEQKRIVSFLDAECGRIDSVIEKTRASIEEYKKLKQAIITQAVTKGIRPNRKMKDSGIPLIDDIPEEWTIQPIKNMAKIYGRIGFRGYTTDDLVEKGEGAITLSPSNLHDLKMIYDKCSYISWAKYEESPEIQIENGNILFVKTGSSYGKSSFVSNLPLPATINPQLIVFKNIKINNRFFLYALQTPSIKNEIEGIVSGGTIPTISQEKIKNIHLCVPKTEEQIEIAGFLDSKCSKIQNIIELKEQTIIELEKMKKSTIFEFVTGKKEV